jgi:hypothetical protein
LASRGVLVAVFIIPIVFSFIYGGTVLSLSFNQDRGTITETTQGDSIEIVNLQSEYTISDDITAQVSATDTAFDCGDLYLTIYNISGGQKKAVKQGAFFDQCFGSDGTLPLDEQFSEKVDQSGQYVIEAQLFDKNGDRFITASAKFTVR